MNALESNARPRAGELPALALVTLAIRLAFAAAACAIFNFAPHELAERGDGLSYLRYAVMILGGPTDEFTAYDARVFPGFPLLLAGLGMLGVPLWMAGIALSMLSAAAAAPLAARVFGDVRVGWLLAIFTPVFVAASSFNGNDTPTLAFSLLGLLLALPGGWVGSILGGLCFGLAGSIRPVACFAVLGLVIYHWRKRRWWPPVVAGAVALGVVLLTLLAVQHWLGDALYSARFYHSGENTYEGELLTWPFKSLIFTPLYRDVAAFKVPYVWGHALFVLAGILLLTIQARRDGKPALYLLALVWLTGNTLFVISLGSHWGFEAFVRFLIPALPPLFFAYRRWSPRPGWSGSGLVWLGLGLASFAVALQHVK